MTWGCAPFVRNIGEINKYLQKETSYLKKKKDEITIRSSAAGYFYIIQNVLLARRQRNGLTRIG